MNDFDIYDEPCKLNLNQTPVNQPLFLEPEEYSNSYYYTCHKNNNNDNSHTNENTNINPIQNLLINHNIKYQKEKENETNNFFVKEVKTTNINTNEIGMPQPQLVNIVSIVNLGKKLNLREIALQCSNSEYTKFL